MGEVVKEALFVRNVLEFLVPGVHKSPIVVCEDNEGAIKLADNALSTARTRHIDIRHHFLREKVDKKEISVQHVESEGQHADVLTKPLSRRLFRIRRNVLLNLPSSWG